MRVWTPHLIDLEHLLPARIDARRPATRARAQDEVHHVFGGFGRLALCILGRHHWPRLRPADGRRLDGARLFGNRYGPGNGGRCIVKHDREAELEGSDGEHRTIAERRIGDRATLDGDAGLATEVQQADRTIVLDGEDGVHLGKLRVIDRQQRGLAATDRDARLTEVRPMNRR